jgi:hypothetical protein
MRVMGGGKMRINWTDKTNSQPKTADAKKSEALRSAACSCPAFPNSKKSLSAGKTFLSAGKKLSQQKNLSEQKKRSQQENISLDKKTKAIKLASPFAVNQMGRRVFTSSISQFEFLGSIFLFDFEPLRVLPLISIPSPIPLLNFQLRAPLSRTAPVTMRIRQPHSPRLGTGQCDYKLI